MNYIVYRLVKGIGKPLFNLFYRAQYNGVDNIPREGNIILAGNHTNNLDAALMISGPNRIVHMLAKKELFNNKVSNIFFRSMGCISVDRTIHDENAKNKAIEVLKDGGVIGIFPEGTTNKTLGTENEVVLLPFKYGAVSFAKKTNSYIIPFCITGEYKLFKKSIKITYGKPYKVNGSLEEENKKLRDKIYKMITEESENEKK